MAEGKLSKCKNLVDLTQEHLFQLQCIVRASNIHHGVFWELDPIKFLALALEFDLVLYYIRDINALPIVKKVSWFQNSYKKVSTLCFDPLGSWLLIATLDSSLYIIPARSLVDELFSSDQKWSTGDITSFSSLNVQNLFSRCVSNNVVSKDYFR